MLFVHEIHSVRGASEELFEEAMRDGWMTALAKTDDARLFWYCVQAHGTGPAYQVVTITATRDGSAWEALARRVQSGDLRAWAAPHGRVAPPGRLQGAATGPMVTDAGARARRGPL